VAGGLCTCSNIVVARQWIGIIRTC
jgi:hypothetical protein